MPILRVALDVPLPRLFDYLAPDAGPSDVGRRVAVPFGRRTLVGVVIEVDERSDVPADKLRPAGAILDDMPPLPAEWLAVARFASEYYQRPLGEVIHAALPTRLRRPLPLRLAPAAYALTDAGRAAIPPARAKAKRAALELLAGGPQPASALPPAALRALVRDGLAAPAEPPRAAVRFVAEHSLTPAQTAAVAAITAAPAYQALLLAGVTGSGKTEVYLHCVARTLALGRQALVLVPEINLTPQLAEAFARRFPGARVVVLTSAVAANERAAAWLAAQSGAAQIVLGTRLAVFAPLPALGLVVVDEEQDASFKQQEGVRYSARDLAVYRAHAAGVPVVLGSATPSLESWMHARTGRYQLLELKERARPGSRLPEVRLVDARVDPAVDGLS
ncbi:MAG: DEAD/DEAH box helicase, partial [Bacteroidota bacterium]